ncbi:hypothetical protein ACFLRX_00615 [Acidobacteriota bacterium]
MKKKNDIQEFSCILINRRISKRGKVLLTTIDNHTKCKFLVQSDGTFSRDGILKTSKSLDLSQKETIKIEYMLELNNPLKQTESPEKIPITIMEVNQVEGGTVAKFFISNVLEQKKKCMFIEYKIAAIMNEIGIRELLNVKRSFYNYVYLPMILLSWSIERLLKCLLNMLAMDDKGTIDSIPYDDKGIRGHDLELLLIILIQKIGEKKNNFLFTSEKKEIDYIKNNKALCKIIKVLSEFGKGSRYFYVDIILKETSTHRNPVHLWDNIENLMHTLTEQKSPPMRSQELEGEIKKLTTKPLKEFLGILEKFINLVGRSKFGDFENVDTSMTYLFDFHMDSDK